MPDSVENFADVESFHCIKAPSESYRSHLHRGRQSRHLPAYCSCLPMPAHACLPSFHPIPISYTQGQGQPSLPGVPSNLKPPMRLPMGHITLHLIAPSKFQHPRPTTFYTVGGPMAQSVVVVPGHSNGLSVLKGGGCGQRLLNDNFLKMFAPTSMVVEQQRTVSSVPTTNVWTFSTVDR